MRIREYIIKENEDMQDGTLAFGDANPLAKKIRDVLGVGDFEEVSVVLPQFERTDGKEISYIPTTVAEYKALQDAPDAVLKDIGLVLWGDGLWLFPVEWYDYIPDGLEITTICDDVEIFHKGKTDNGKRYGCLAYGVKKQLEKNTEAEPCESESTS